MQEYLGGWLQFIWMGICVAYLLYSVKKIIHEQEKEIG